MESNQPDSAIIHFEKILDMGNSKYEVPAKWLLGLTLATNNREKEAFPLLQELSQQPNDSYREKAEEVLDILKND